MYEYRLRFSKEANFKFLSHLELIKTFERALRRAQIPLAYSEGFHPHPKMSFGPALAVGVSSIDEYFDLDLREEWNPDELVTRLNPALPAGLEIIAARRCKAGVKPLNAIINRAAYLIELTTNPEVLNLLVTEINAITAAAEIMVNRTNKNISKTVNIRPWIHSIKTEISSTNRLQIRITGEIGSGGNLRPDDILALITQPVEAVNFVRVGLWHEQQGLVKKPLDFCEKTGG
jgi:radical SAM-linked protein